METKEKLKVGDKIKCISTHRVPYVTIGKTYKIININKEKNIFTFTDDKYEDSLNIDFFDRNFMLKEEQITLNEFISDNWGEKLKINDTAYKETEGKLFYELDFEFITQMAERMASNKGKYEPFNWQKLDNIEDLKQALFRHTLEVMEGKFEDDGRDFGHLEAIACDVMMIYYQLKKK